jgi:hypothetical protein
MSADDEELFETGDPFDDPHWQRASVTVGAPQPAKGYWTCNTAWAERVLPRIRHKNQLVILLVLYSKCLRTRSRTVALSNEELQPFGVTRRAKCRALAALRKAELVAPAETRIGTTIRVTLLEFP